MKKKLSFLYISLLLFILPVYVTAADRADQQREFYKIQRESDEALNKAVNNLTTDIDKFIDYKEKHGLKEKIFNRGLTQEQQNICDNYQLETTPENRESVKKNLTMEQEYKLNGLIEENKIIKKWEQSLRERQQNIVEWKQENDRRDQQWAAINQQTDQLERRQDAAWARLQDSIQKLGDDMYRRSFTPYLIKVPTPTQP